jgi:hypothetical protein
MINIAVAVRIPRSAITTRSSTRVKPLSLTPENDEIASRMALAEKM